MAGSERELRRELGEERERLAEAVGTLRTEIGKATDIRGKLRAKLRAAPEGEAGRDQRERDQDGSPDGEAGEGQGRAGDLADRAERAEHARGVVRRRRRQRCDR